MDNIHRQNLVTMCTGCLRNIQISQIFSNSRIYSFTSPWCDLKSLKQLSHVRAPTCVRIHMFLFPTLRVNSRGPLLSHYLACICWIPGPLRSWEASAPRSCKHGGGEKYRAPALTVDWSHQAIRDQAEPLIDFIFGIQIWVKSKTFILWFPLHQYFKKKKEKYMNQKLHA